MASTKYKASHKKRLHSELREVVSSLRKERGNLKKTLAETSRQHSELHMLVQRFLSLETVRLESCQHQNTVVSEAALPSEQCSEREDLIKVSIQTQRNASDYVSEIKELKSKTGDISCQDLERKVAGKKDFMSNTQDSTSGVEELQNQLRHALEKNKQWLEYDQQREAYVRGILDRMLWLEKQLNEANQARIQQHKEDHSDEKKQIVEMQVHYERLLLKAKGELEELRKEIDLTNQNLKTTQNWCKVKEIEVEKLQLQLKTEKIRERSAREDECCPQNVDQQLKALKCALDEERRRSANFELQANLIQKCMLNLHYEDQEKIAVQERQMKITLQDLEDKKQDCSYLKKQMIRMLKALQKTQDQRDQQDQHLCEAEHPPSELSSSHSSFLNESLLECPGCQTEYPASHYRELMSHIEVCLK